MKHILTGILLPILFACNNQQADNADKSADTRHADTTVVTPAPQHTVLIIPGKSIGRLEIGLATDSAIVWLGKPDSSDAAMGSA